MHNPVSSAGRVRSKTGTRRSRPLCLQTLMGPCDVVEQCSILGQRKRHLESLSSLLKLPCSILLYPCKEMGFRLIGFA